MHDSYFIGITQQVAAGGLARLAQRGQGVLPAHAVYPSRTAFHAFAEPIIQVLRQDPHVHGLTLSPVLGRYGLSQELSVGLELQAGAGFDAAALAGVVFRQARAAEQTDAFVARVLPPDEWTDNARPGLTLRFHQPQRISAFGPLRALIACFGGGGWPIDGFTTIPTEAGGVGGVLGLRYIFLPEISVRWDMALRARLAGEADEADIILLDQAAKIGRLCQVLARDPLVASARLNWFDVMVAGLEDYDTVLAALAREGTVRAAACGSMTRKPFSEILALSNAGVLQQRLALLGGGECLRAAG